MSDAGNKTDTGFICCASLAFLNTFTFKAGGRVSNDDTVRKLQNIGVKAESCDPDLEDFKTAEAFLLPDNITRRYFRLKMNDFSVSFPRLQEKCYLSSSVKVGAFLTLYPEFDIGSLLFNMYLESCTIDELIFLSQCFGSRFKIHIEGLDFIKLHTDNVLIKDILFEYIRLISTGFGLEVGNPNILTSKCVEIHSLSNRTIQNPQALLNRFPRQIYGLLASDEGWRFVPEDVAIERTNMKWRTRNFIFAVPFHRCILLINFDTGDIHKRYEESQNLLRTKFGYPIEDYFMFKPKIAGLNHGPLLMLEVASLQYYMLEQALNNIAQSKPKSIRSFLIQQEELMKTLFKLAQIKIREIDILGRNIEETMGLASKTDDVNRRLEEIEKVLNIKYNQRINFWMIVLALLGIVIALVSLPNIRDFLLHHGIW